MFRPKQMTKILTSFTRFVLPGSSPWIGSYGCLLHTLCASFV